MLQARNGRTSAGRVKATSMGFVGLAAAALALSACSSSLDSAKLSETITAKIQEVAPGATASVTCPSDVKPQAGATFTCEATINNQNTTLTVTQTDDKGNVTFKSDAAVISFEKAQTALVTQLNEKVPGEYQAKCVAPGAETYYIAKPGATFECTVSGTTADGSSGEQAFTATVKDVDGNVSFDAK